MPNNEIGACKLAVLSTKMCRPALSLVEVVVVIAISGVLLALLFPAIQLIRARSQQIECRNHLRQIGVALHNYHGIHGVLPAGHYFQNGQSQMMHASWCIQILPFVEQDVLWQRIRAAFEIDPNFLGAAHTERGRVLNVLTCPSEGRSLLVAPAYARPIAFTMYLGVEGTDQKRRDGMLFSDSSVHLPDVADGLSSTLLVGERPPSADFELGWWYAGWGQNKDGSAEMVLGVREHAVYRTVASCTSVASRFRLGNINNQCDVLHFWSLHPSGSNFLMADGSVRFLSYSADPIMPALATRAGGETVSAP